MRSRFLLLCADCKRCRSLPAAGCSLPQHSAHEEGTAEADTVVVVGVHLLQRELTAWLARRWTSTPRTNMT